LLPEAMTVCTDPLPLSEMGDCYLKTSVASSINCEFHFK
jgi:hypothetical protein